MLLNVFKHDFWLMRGAWTRSKAFHPTLNFLLSDAEMNSWDQRGVLCVVWVTLLIAPDMLLMLGLKRIWWGDIWFGNIASAYIKIVRDLINQKFYLKTSFRGSASS